MKDVQDRIVQFSNRYKLTNVETGEVLGTFDFDEVTGTVEQVGTEIDAELFKNFAQIDGNYPSLMSGGVVATVLSDEDLNEFRGADYWGKRFYAAGGNSVLNRPYNGSFSLDVIRAGSGVTIQVFSTYDENPDGRPTTYQRVCQSGTSAWQPWEEIVTSDGSYPNLGAGHLQEIQINTRSSDAVGWYKCGEFDVSRNTGSGDLSCSVILQINGTNYGNYSESAINAAPSGQIEVDARITSGAFVNKYSSVGIISGNIASTDFCVCSSSDGKKMNLYVNISHRYRDFKITKISEGQENVPSPNIFVFADEYYGTSAPSNAIYAVVRNQASSLGGKKADEFVDTTSNQSVGGQKTFTKTVHFDVDNNYLMGIDGIPAGNYKDIVFNDEDGDRIATIRVQNNTDDTSPNTRIEIGSNGPNHEAPAGVAIIRDATRTRVEVVQPPASANNAEVATTSWVVDKGYLTAVPAASQTVVGGAKMWVSNGKLYIKTT